MIVNFNVTLDNASKNNIILEPDGHIKCNAKGSAYLWLAEGNFCLIAERRSGKITGLTGNLNTVKITPKTFQPIYAMEGKLSATRKLPHGIIIGYNGEGVYYDGDNHIVWFGNPSEGDISVRIAKNLIVALKDGHVIGVVIENLTIICSVL